MRLRIEFKGIPLIPQRGNPAVKLGIQQHFRGMFCKLRRHVALDLLQGLIGMGTGQVEKRPCNLGERLS